MLDMWDILVLTGAGVISGFINVLAGGGSMVTFPVLIMMGMPATTANGTNRISIFLQCISALLGFFKNGISDIRLSLSLSLCALPGAVLGAVVGAQVPEQAFQRILGLLMLILIVVMQIRKQKSPLNKASRNRYIWAHILMVGAGFYGGFIQAGVGFLIIAILHSFLGLDMVRVNLHKVFVVMVYTVFAIIIFGMRGLILWVPALVLSGGGIVGAWIGSHFAVKKGKKAIDILLRLTMFVFAIRLLFF